MKIILDNSTPSVAFNLKYRRRPFVGFNIKKSINYCGQF